MTPTAAGPRRGALFAIPRALVRHHVFGSLFILCVATWVIAQQVETRDDFASSELVKDVESRWGAPVAQPAPSVRYVESGSIFTELKPLPLDRQHVSVDARMNYRKRGLRYFSGFDFTFTGDYAVANPEPHDIDVAFVFPIEMDKSQVLLSELRFTVNGTPADLDLGEGANRLTWTGRIPTGTRATFSIQYRARGLDQFVYRLDPSLPARDVDLSVNAIGGDNYDFPPNVLSATRAAQTSHGISLQWTYPSLESGVSIGVVLPSEKRFDSVIAVMARRAWAPFLCWMAVLFAAGARHQRRFALYEAYLLAAAFGFTFVLLSYLAAFMSFYVAYGAVMLGMGAVSTLYLKRLIPEERTRSWIAAWEAGMVLPTAAVILTGYTGLIYTLEILCALLGLMALSTRPAVRVFLADALGRLTSAPQPTGAA